MTKRTSPWSTDDNAPPPNPQLLSKAWEAYAKQTLRLVPEDLEFALAKDIFFSGASMIDWLYTTRKEAQENPVLQAYVEYSIQEEIQLWLLNRKDYHKDLSRRIEEEENDRTF